MSQAVGDDGIFQTADNPTRDRDRSILAMRAEGLTLEEIAKRVGLTRERVRQIVRNNGGASAREARAAAVRQLTGFEAELSAAIERAVLHGECGRYADIESRFDLSAAEAHRATPRSVATLLEAPSTPACKWTDEQVFEALRTAATFEYPLGRKKYEALLNAGEVQGPSGARVEQLFGWAKACEMAGVETRQARRDYQSTWTDDDLRYFAREYLRGAGPTASFAGYDTWRRRAQLPAPSSQTLRNRLGRWVSIKRAVLLESESANTDRKQRDDH